MFEKEAEEIANKRCHEIMCYGHCSFSSPKHHRCGEWHREYECALKGAESREKRIAELEAQIEKMKCCENCRYCNEWGEANSNSPNCKKCNWVSNWKLRR